MEVTGDLSVSGLYVDYGGVLNIDGTEILLTNSGSDGRSGNAITLTNGGVINFNSGEINLETTGEGCAFEIGANASYTVHAVLNMNGGTINARNNKGTSYVFGMPYAYNRPIDLNINGGEINVNATGDGESYCFFVTDHPKGTYDPAITISKEKAVINIGDGNNYLKNSILPDENITYK
jgi:hypothetical protein